MTNTFSNSEPEPNPEPDRCFICLESDQTKSNQLKQPCKCNLPVHEFCLNRNILENRLPRCNICQTNYIFQQSYAKMFFNGMLYAWVLATKSSINNQTTSLDKIICAIFGSVFFIAFSMDGIIPIIFIPDLWLKSVLIGVYVSVFYLTYLEFQNYCISTTTRQIQIKYLLLWLIFCSFVKYTKMKFVQFVSGVPLYFVICCFQVNRLGLILLENVVIKHLDLDEMKNRALFGRLQNYKQK